VSGLIIFSNEYSKPNSVKLAFLINLVSTRFWDIKGLVRRFLLTGIIAFVVC
jgi:hypothetical protein